MSTLCPAPKAGLFLAQVDGKNAWMGFPLRTLAICICCLAVTTAARAQDPCAEGELISAQVSDKQLRLTWIGTVRDGMAKRIIETFEPLKDRVGAVTLRLHSCGGDSDAMRRTIEVLRGIRQTHHLSTVVQLGGTCSSACIPIFLQGERRYAALTSVWAFHQSSWQDRDRIDRDAVVRRSDMAETDKKLKEYYEPAGVSKRWLKRLRSHILFGEWWQTGRDLWEEKSGIITEVLSNSYPNAGEERQHLSPAVICGTFCRG